MAGYTDIMGQRFGHLVVLKFAGRNYHKQTRWRCQCDCGNQITAYAHDLANARSCGWDCPFAAPASDRIKPTISAPHPPTEADIRRMLEQKHRREQELEDIRAAVRDGRPLPAPQVNRSRW